MCNNINTLEMRTRVRNLLKTPDEGWSVYHPKCRVNKKQHEHKYPSTNVNNIQ